MEDERNGLTGSWLFGIVAGLIVIALIVAAYSAGVEEGKDEAAPATTAQDTAERPAAAGPGRRLFVSKCGSCHTLKAAGTSGQVGPDLDQLKPGAAQALAAIRNGGTGSGGMPKDLVTGRDAQEVAGYVAQAAGG